MGISSSLPIAPDSEAFSLSRIKAPDMQAKPRIRSVNCTRRAEFTRADSPAMAKPPNSSYSSFLFYWVLGRCFLVSLTRQSTNVFQSHQPHPSCLELQTVSPGPGLFSWPFWPLHMNFPLIYLPRMVLVFQESGGGGGVIHWSPYFAHLADGHFWKVSDHTYPKVE